jgi:hypothetical protein
MSDDLFSPTIKTPSAPAAPPWRPESIVYPAIFGGPLAATVLGLLNGRRLGVRPGPMVLIALAGVAAIVARVVVTVLLAGGTGTRVIGSLAGAAVWGAVEMVQRRPFRVFLYNDGEPASLVGPGLAAAIGCGLVEAVVIFGVLP